MNDIEKLKQEYSELLEIKQDICMFISKHTRDYSDDTMQRIYSELNSIISRIDYLKPIVITSVIADSEIELKTAGETNSLLAEYLIYLKGTQTCVGSITYRGYHVSDYFGDIEYRIEEKFNGNGYAYKALCLVSNILAENDIPDFWITCEASNIASLKTIKKYGEIQGEKETNRVMLFDCGTRVLTKDTENKL